MQSKRIGAKRQFGQGMTEYLIVVALIAISSIMVFSSFGRTLRFQVAGVSQELSGQSAGGKKGAIKMAQKSADYAKLNAKHAKSMSDYQSEKYLYQP